MNVRLVAPPWVNVDFTEEAAEAIKIVGDGVWREASIKFSAERENKIRAGKSAPKGMQRYLNEVLVEKFNDNGWEGEAGYFFKEKTWVRLTFRHQMSLGSDILDALKVCKIEKMELAIIMAANRNTLDIISPNDAAAIISYEKLENEIMSLNGAIDIPLIIGELTPLTSASEDINQELKKSRPRDITLPG